jgi:hypothetical protein
MIKKIFLFYCMVLLLSSVSAFEFDNLKGGYDDATKTVTIKNSLLGIPTTTEGTARLITDNHVIVGVGEDVLVAEIEITSFSDYNDVLGGINFYNKKYVNNLINKEFTLRYSIPTQETVEYAQDECRTQTHANGSKYENCATIVKTKTVTVDNWYDFDGRVNKESKKIGIFTDVYPGDYVEWIPNIMGVEVSEWASFQAIERKISETDSTTATLNSLGGQLATAHNFTANWTGKVDIIEAYMILGSAVSSHNRSVGIYSSNGTAPNSLIGSWSEVEVLDGKGTGWINWTLTENDSLVTEDTEYWVVFNLSEGSPVGYLRFGEESGTHQRYLITNNADYSVWESFGANIVNMTINVWGATQVADLGVTSALLAPVNAESTFNKTMNFTANITADTGNLTNATINVWYSNSSLFNQTTNTLSGKNISNTSRFEITLVADNYIWGVEGCVENSTNSVCANSANRTLTILPFTINSQTYNTETLEGTREIFIVNVTSDSGSQISTAYFNYNNTDTTPTIDITNAPEYILRAEVTTPSVEENTNISFFWNISLNTGSTFLTTALNQTVKNISFDDCSTHSILLLNYTLRDEEFQNILNGSIENTTIDIELNLYAPGTNNNVLNYSSTYNETNPAQVCTDIELNGSTYDLDATTRYLSTLRAVEYHNMQNFNLSNTSIPQNIDLYDLLQTDATEFLITYRDEYFLPVEDALIQIQRKYVADGTYKTVEIPLTDQSGQAKAQFDLDGVIYTIIVMQNNTILASFDKVAVVCEDSTNVECRLTLNPFLGGTPPEDFETLNNLNYVMNYNETSRQITTVFNTVDGSTATVRINATQYTAYANNTICGDSLTTSSGTLTCTIPESYGNTTVVARLMINDDLAAVRMYQSSDNAFENYGYIGILLLLIMTVTLPLMFLGSKIMMLISSSIGFIAAGLLNVYTSGGIVGVGATLLWLFVGMGIILWKIMRDQER